MFATLASLILLSPALAAESPQPELRLAEVAGETRVDLPKPRAGRPLPYLPAGSKVRVLSGHARLDAAIPATVWLNQGDEVAVHAALRDARGRPGLLLEARQGLIEVDPGPGHLLLEPGDGVVLRDLAQGRVGVEAAYGYVEAATEGWRGILLPGETVAFQGSRGGFRYEALDMSRVAARSVAGARAAAFVLEGGHLEVAGPSSSPMGAEEDLRSAVGPLPQAKAPARGYWPPLPSGSPARGATKTPVEGVTIDSVMTSAFVCLGALLFGWWWGRKHR